MRYAVSEGYEKLLEKEAIRRHKSVRITLFKSIVRAEMENLYDDGFMAEWITDKV